MRDICQTLGVNQSSFYYQPREDPSEEVLRAEIEKLAGVYPRYGSPCQSVIGRVNFGRSYEFRLCPQTCAISSCFPHFCFQQCSWSPICGVRFTEWELNLRSTIIC